MNSICGSFQKACGGEFYLSTWLGHEASDIWLNMILGLSVRFWMRLTFESEDSVKQIACPVVGRTHPVGWRLSEENFALASRLSAGTTVSSCLWTRLEGQHWLSQFSGLQTAYLGTSQPPQSYGHFFIFTWSLFLLSCSLSLHTRTYVRTHTHTLLILFLWRTRLI